jgi:hypothetical protein
MAGLEGEFTLSIYTNTNTTTNSTTDKDTVSLQQLWPPLTAAQQQSAQVST